ncbi:MAG: hypothetical protein ABIH49_02255 [archaeon]
MGRFTDSGFFELLVCSMIGIPLAVPIGGFVDGLVNSYTPIYSGRFEGRNVRIEDREFMPSRRVIIDEKEIKIGGKRIGVIYEELKDKGIDGILDKDYFPGAQEFYNRLMDEVGDVVANRNPN